MNAIPEILSMGTTLVLFALVVAAVMKLFQLGSDVREMKDALLDIRRNTLDSMRPHGAPAPGGHAFAPDMPMPVATGAPPTPEELVRAVHAQKFGDDFPL